MSTAFAFLTVYATLNKQHLKIYHKIDGKSPQKGETQPPKKKKKCSTLFSAPNHAQQKQRQREGDRNRETETKRKQKSARAFHTILFRKNRTKSTSQKNKHTPKEEESSREGTSRKIQKKGEKYRVTLDNEACVASGRVGSAEVSAQVRGRATALLAFLTLSTAVSSVSIRNSSSEMLVLLRP